MPRHLATVIAIWIAAAAFVAATPARALPTIKDQWHFFCGPEVVPDKMIRKMEARASGGGGAIAKLTLACLQEIRENEEYKKRLAKFEQAPKGQPPKPDNRRSAETLKEAVDALQGAYQTNKKNPKVLFNYAMGLAMKGDVRAVNIIDELQTQFPENKFARDAYLILAEHYFERRDVEKAFREYNVVLKKGRPIVQAWVRYKMAWINFAIAIDAKDRAKQSKAIGELVALKERLDKMDGDREERLAGMIEGDVSELLAQQGDVNEAKRILKALNADDVYAAVLERMAQVKLGNNDVNGAYQLYEIALREAPERKESFNINLILLQLAAQKTDIARLNQQLRYMVANYVTGKSPWRVAQQKDKGLLEKAAAQTEEQFFNYATAIDGQGRQTNNDPRTLAVAKSLYELYVKTFKKAKHFADVQLNYGQILFLQKDYIRATRSLIETVKKNPESKTAKDTASLMVTAAQYAVDTDKVKYDIPPAGTAHEKITIPLPRQTYADALDAYVKVFPEDQNAQAMMYAAASVYYDFGHYDEATKRLLAFCRRYPASDNAKTAAIAVLTYYDNQFDQKGVAKAINTFYDSPPLGSEPAVTPYIKKLQVKAKAMKKLKGGGESKEKNHDQEDGDADGDDGESKGKKGKGKAKKGKGKGKAKDDGDEFGNVGEDELGGGLGEDDDDKKSKKKPKKKKSKKKKKGDDEDDDFSF